MRQAHEMLEQVTGQGIRDTDFTDDWLAIMLCELSPLSAGQAIGQILKVCGLDKEQHAHNSSSIEHVV